jgi:hypothetical protein
MSMPSLKPAAIAIALAFASPIVSAASFVYEGRLDDLGAPANGRYDLRLTPYGDIAHGPTLTAPLSFPAVEVRDGRFRLDVDLPLVTSDAVWLEVAVRASDETGFSAIPGRSKAIAAPLVGACWSTTGDSGSDPATNFIGTTDAQPFVVRTANAPSLRIAPSAETFGTPALPITTNMIGGSHANTVSTGVRGATIAGGGVPAGDSEPLYSLEAPNRVTDHYGTVGGGYTNRAGNDDASPTNGAFATVAGGFNNTASGVASTVAGGDSNCAGATSSWAGGRNAKVRPATNPLSGSCSGLGTYPGGSGDSGTFVWADDQFGDFISTGSNQFLVRAQGGAAINSNSPLGNALRVNGTLRVDTLGTAAATTLCRNASNQISGCSSSARYKQDISDLELGLETALRLHAVGYRWKDSGTADIGFVAEEIAAIDERLVTRNFRGEIEGVKYDRLTAVFANAVQELAARGSLAAEEIARVGAANRALHAESAELRARLERIETALGERLSNRH